eukprot:GEMP01010789.1.p1 GENE.GEMP01010789.1~~GEMP01010789.1.p1  ORF type:complete len:545 (+),score=106.92 GEMP01010789.1:406-2040(+)
MTDTTEQSALQKQPKRKTRRASSVRISNVLEVDDGGLHSMARSSINAIDQGKSAELGLFSDPVVSTSAKSFRGSVRFHGNPEEVSLADVDAAASITRPAHKLDTPSKSILSKISGDSGLSTSSPVRNDAKPSKAIGSMFQPVNDTDDIEDIGAALHCFDEECEAKVRDMFRTEMLVLHNELRDYKKHNTMLDRQVRVLQTQLRRMTDNLTIARTLMMKDHINNWDKIVKQLSDHKKKTDMNDGASQSLLIEFTDRLYNALVLTNKLWNQHRIQCGQREMTVLDFPTIFDEEVLHDWDDYNESMNHDLEAMELLDKTEEKMFDAEKSKMDVAQSAIDMRIHDTSVDLEKVDVPIGPQNDDNQASVSEVATAISSESSRRLTEQSYRKSASAPLGALGKAQHLLKRKVKTLMAASRTRRALSQSLSNIQLSAKGGRKRGKIDAVDEVAGLLSTLERPTCVGMLDHQAMHIVRIQHKVRVFLARRRRIKSELVRSWYKADLEAGAAIPSLRTQQLKLFCIENDIADAEESDPQPDMNNTSILRQSRF